MNDKSVSILDNYDFEVQSTAKGRGTIICDTNQGKVVLEEYTGSVDKLELIENLLLQLLSKGFDKTDMIVRNKEGNLYCRDGEGTAYIVKHYCEGRECSVKNKEELIAAAAVLGYLHRMFEHCNLDCFADWKPHTLQNEIERHNKELRHVRMFIRRKGDKTAFERALLMQFPFFLEKATRVEELIHKQDIEEIEQAIIRKRTVCHGDYQYHNVIITTEGIAVIHFEALRCECMMRDLYLFGRKVMEKYNWSIALWEQLIQAYESVRKISREEWNDLYYRFLYPEKFWKIVNFYQNNRKSWQPEKNMQKLQRVMEQEIEKEKFMTNIRKHVDYYAI